MYLIGIDHKTHVRLSDEFMFLTGFDMVNHNANPSTQNIEQFLCVLVVVVPANYILFRGDVVDFSPGVTIDDPIEDPAVVLVNQVLL